MMSTGACFRLCLVSQVLRLMTVINTAPLWSRSGSVSLVICMALIYRTMRRARKSGRGCSSAALPVWQTPSVPSVAGPSSPIHYVPKA